MPIANISDTARLTAYARAVEAERPDALFLDPFSRRLAGSEGEALARETGAVTTMAGALASRTAVFDELVLEKVRNEEVDLVVNLAAGLDTRVWRLDLPPRLRWVDVDLPGILSYKAELMSGERTACAYETQAVDLTRPLALMRLLGRLGPAKRILALSEGLLVYMRPEQVGRLARQLHYQGAIGWWITDLAGPRALAMLERSWGAVLTGSRFQFAPQDPVEFFRRHGWRETQFRSSQVEAHRLGRSPGPSLFGRVVTTLMPARLREELRRLSGCAVFARDT